MLTLWTLLFKLKCYFFGIKVGKNLKCYGPVLLRFSSRDFFTLEIGDNVTLLPNVELKCRGNGKIYIGNNCQLDSFSRVLAAENREVSLDDEVRVGHSSIINGGEDIYVGEKTAIANFCVLQASEHVVRSGTQNIIGGEYIRGAIKIGKSSWIASHVVVRPNTKIGDNVVVGAFSLVSGDLQSNKKYFGVPAKERTVI